MNDGINGYIALKMQEVTRFRPPSTRWCTKASDAISAVAWRRRADQSLTRTGSLVISDLWNGVAKAMAFSPRSYGLIGRYCPATHTRMRISVPFEVKAQI